MNPIKYFTVSLLIYTFLFTILLLATQALERVGQSRKNLIFLLLCWLYCPLFIQDIPLGWSCALGTNVLGNKQSKEAEARRASSVANHIAWNGWIYFRCFYFIHMARNGVSHLLLVQIWKKKNHSKRNRRLARSTDALPNWKWKRTGHARNLLYSSVLYFVRVSCCDTRPEILVIEFSFEMSHHRGTGWKPYARQLKMLSVKVCVSVCLSASRKSRYTKNNLSCRVVASSSHKFPLKY